MKYFCETIEKPVSGFFFGNAVTEAIYEMVSPFVSLELLSWLLKTKIFLASAQNLSAKSRAGENEMFICHTRI